MVQADVEIFALRTVLEAPMDLVKIRPSSLFLFADLAHNRRLQLLP